MQILIDARSLNKDYSGTGSYALNLLRTLARIDETNSYRVLVHDSFHGDLELGDNFRVEPVATNAVSVGTLTKISYKMRGSRNDIYHSLVPFLPLGVAGGRVATVFDTDLHAPTDSVNEAFLFNKILREPILRYGFSHTVKRADYLISTSYATKKNLIREFPEAVNKVLTIHTGLDDRAFEEPSEEEIFKIKERFNLPDKFLFYIGSTRQDKNLPMMLDAFEEFIRKNPAHEDLFWVMVLNKDENFEELFARIRKRNLLERIRIFEQVSTFEKRVLHRLATLLYFVTHYQGGCFPVLEAQAQGTPALVSTGDVVKEIGGKGVLRADANRKDAIVNGLERFFGEAGLSKTLSEAGLDNVKRFSWDRAARETLAMYEHLM